MTRLEMLVVHLEEALRVSRLEDIPHQRVALLLLDSAAELMLHRATEVRLIHNEYDLELLERSDRTSSILGAAPDANDFIEDLRRTVVSRRRTREIRKYFDPKIEFLESVEALGPETGRALRKLHAYRNEAYHRDHVRPGSLRSAVSIYRFLALTLMRDLEMDWFIELTNPHGLEPYFDRYGRRSFSELRERIAEGWLNEYSLGSRSAVAQALADHATDRLDGLIESLEVIASAFTDPSREEWESTDILTFLQAESPVARPMLLAEVRLCRVPVTQSVLESLRVRTTNLAELGDVVAAFAEFADIEDAFEPVERKADKLETEIDRYEQLQIDIARGK